LEFGRLGVKKIKPRASNVPRKRGRLQGQITLLRGQISDCNHRKEKCFWAACPGNLPYCSEKEMELGHAGANLWGREAVG